MLRAAIGLFILGFVSMLLGGYSFAVMSIEVGKILLTVFLILALISSVARIITGRDSHT